MTQRLKIRDMKASLYFNGSSYVQLPAIATSNVISVSAWIRTPSNIPSGSIDILGRSAGTSDLLEINTSGSLRFNVMTNVGPNSNVSRANILTKNKWHHVVGTYSVATATNKIYLDGVLVSTYTTPSGPLSNNANTWIIGALTSATRNFTGNICHVGIWDAELSASEIDSLYSNGTIPRQDLCVAYYPLEEGGGSSVYDKFNRATAGTIVSATFSADVPVTVRQKINPNLVPNGDFSYAPPGNTPTTSAGLINGQATGSAVSAASGLPLRWYRQGGVGSNSAMYDRSNPFSGKPSLKISLTATASYAEIFLVNSFGANSANYNGKYIPVQPSTSYTYSFWTKTNLVSGSSSHGAAISFIQSKEDGSTASLETTTSYVKVSQEWTRYTGTLTMTASTAYLQVNPRVYGHTGAGTLIMDAWFADIQLYPVTTVSRTAVAPRTRTTAQEMLGSLYFGGSNRVNTGTPANFTTPVTFMGWLKIVDLTAVQTIIGGTIGNGLILRVNTSGTLTFWADGGFSNVVLTTTANKVPVGRWFHFAMSYDYQNVKVYFDGQLVSTAAFTGVFTSYVCQVQLGQRNAVEGFKGYQCNMQVYNKVLNSVEISNNKNYGSIVQNNCIGFWKLNEGSGTTAKDYSGNNYDGSVLSGTYTTDSPLVSRQRINIRSKASLYFNSSAATNYVSVTHQSQYIFNRNLTTAYWFKTSKYMLDSATLSKGIGSKNPFDWRWINSNGQLSFICYDGTFQPIAGTKLLPNTWYHLVGTRNGSTLKLFVNGVLVNSVTDTTVSDTDNTTDINFGKRTGGTQWLDGNLKDIRIWNRALTSVEISDLYFKNAVPDSGLVGEWRLDEGAGSTAIDSSNYKNNGTITGAVYTNDVPN